MLLLETRFPVAALLDSTTWALGPFPGPGLPFFILLLTLPACLALLGDVTITVFLQIIQVIEGYPEAASVEERI